MGSFNTTCFASNQTIAPGDACRVIPIVRTKDFQPVQLLVQGEPASAYGATSSNCYVDAFWKPLGGCIAAVYDDYGQFKLSMSTSVCLQLLAFYKMALESFPVVLQGENECHDVPFDFRAFLAAKAPLVQALLAERDIPSHVEEDPALFAEVEACWDYLWEVAREQRLFQAQRGVMAPVQFAVVHEVAFQALRDKIAGMTAWNGESLAPQAWAARTLDDVLKHIGELRSSDDSDTEVNKQVLASMSCYSFSSCVNDALRSLRGNNLPTPRLASRTIHDLARQHMAGTLTPEIFLTALSPFLDEAYFYGGLEELGPRLSPMVYAGQDYSNEIGQAYVKFVTEVSHGVTRGRKSHYGGPFATYSVRLPDEAVIEALSNTVSEWDGAVDNVRLCRYRIEKANGDVESFVEVTLDCTLSPQEFAQLFTEFLDENELDGSIIG